MSVEKLKARVTDNIQYLKQCTDYATRKAMHAASDTDSVLLDIDGHPDTEKALAKHIATLNLGKLFHDIWKSMSKFITQEGTFGYYSLNSLMSMYVNITDISDDVSKEMGEAGCLGVMIEALDKYRDKYTGSGPLLSIFITTLNCIQECTENVSIYRKANAIAVVKRYLDSDDMATKARSLRILAYVVDEEESCLLQTSKDGVGFLLSLVKDAIANKSHRAEMSSSSTCSALELLRSLNKLAVNDSNKREIARLGGIDVFTKMLTNDFSEDEQCAAVQALLNMSFIIKEPKELKKSMKGLEKLTKSNNQHLQQMATYALWQSKGQHLSKPKTAEARNAPPSYEEAMTQPKSTKPRAQVMISYQWDNQKTTKKLRDLLVKAGYQVWMDVTHMRGSLLDAMATAVETSSLVLVCMSERYKNSENCRAEAQYAHTLKKPIVPLLLEPDYKPDGWLGIIGLTKLYYNVTSPEDLDSQMTEILAGIQSALGRSDYGDDVDGPIQPTQQVVTSQEPSSSTKAARQWSKEYVQEWLSDNNLSKLCEAFEGLKGRHLDKMYDEMRKNEDAFKRELATDYEMDGKTRMMFIVALEEAFED